MIDATEITPVILAAGDSSRIGYPKALLPLGEETFIGRILSVLTKLDLDIPTIVLGRQAKKIQQAIALGPSRIVINPNPENGQISSIRLAVEAVSPSCQACLIWPVDQPLISASLAAELVNAFLALRPTMVMPCRGQRRGHPVIIGRRLFAELLQASLEEGLKTLVRKYERQIVLIPTEETAATDDVDTPEDYVRLIGAPLKLEEAS